MPETVGSEEAANAAATALTQNPNPVETTGAPVSSAVAKANTSASAALVAETGSSPDLAEARKTYLFAIAAEARRIKKYPARAFAAGWTGTAEIHVTVHAGGIVQPPQLLKSSGYIDIDNAALSITGTALKRTPVPESLRERNIDFVLPVSFTINDS